ncbi:hypothetical protein A1D17_04545 [Pseudomonas fluorescens]|uniref:Uncharacterized protein n=1 Tax=Pseudomonas fluorescens TaxID=294 RepID=A0A162B318_PSEFL|nr:hypothetical protein A1D17_04545 [Pseudomonas fluorescens]
MVGSKRTPVPQGTKISFCEHEAKVVSDPGGDFALTVEVDGHHANWYWSFEGVSCTILSLPDHQNLQA